MWWALSAQLVPGALTELCVVKKLSPFLGLCGREARF